MEQYKTRWCSTLQHKEVRLQICKEQIMSIIVQNKTTTICILNGYFSFSESLNYQRTTKTEHIISWQFSQWKLGDVFKKNELILEFKSRNRMWVIDIYSFFISLNQIPSKKKGRLKLWNAINPKLDLGSWKIAIMFILKVLWWNFPRKHHDLWTFHKPNF